MIHERVCLLLSIVSFVGFVLTIASQCRDCAGSLQAFLQRPALKVRILIMDSDWMHGRVTTFFCRFRIGDVHFIMTSLTTSTFEWTEQVLRHVFCFNLFFVNRLYFVPTISLHRMTSSAVSYHNFHLLASRNTFFTFCSLMGTSYTFSSHLQSMSMIWFCYHNCCHSHLVLVVMVNLVGCCKIYVASPLHLCLFIHLFICLFVCFVYLTAHLTWLHRCVGSTIRHKNTIKNWRWCLSNQNSFRKTLPTDCMLFVYIL